MAVSDTADPTPPRIADSGDVADAVAAIGGNVNDIWRSWWTWSASFGTHNLQLPWGVIGVNSTVVIIASEIDANGTRFIGAAPIRASSIAPGAGVVNFKIHIEWNSPIRMRTDVLVFN